MALQKQSVNINFAQGLDTKTDPNQVFAAGTATSAQISNFLALNNMVFTKGKALTKRNGFSRITVLPNAEQTTLTTLNGNLIATGSNLYAYGQELNQWTNQGLIQPVDLSVKTMVRRSTSQSSPDIALTSEGLSCLVYEDSGSSYYEVIDSNTGQHIVSHVLLPNSASNARVYLVGNYFVILFISSAPSLQYVAIPATNPQNPSSPTTVSAIVASPSAGYDATVNGNVLFISWAASATTIGVTSLTNGLAIQSPMIVNGHTATLMSATSDNSIPLVPVIWFSFWDSSSMNGYAMAYTYTYDQISTVNMIQVLPPTHFITGEVLAEMTSAAQNAKLSVFYEVSNTYSSPYPTANVRTDYINANTVAQAGVVGTKSTILRSVGLGSKAFLGPTGTIYMLVEYGDTNQASPATNSNQPSYFLIDSTGGIYMRLAYSNGGGYEANQVLPNVTEISGSYITPYLIQDFLATVNKGTALPAGTPSNAIYTQTGINLATFSINTSGQYSSEIASTLHLTGGQLWMYDAVKPVEHGFQVWPENIASTTATGSGGLIAQEYFYVFTYEWTDNQGNLHRSAPSIPFLVTTTTGSSTNTLYVPTLRLTYKLPPNPVRIVGYRLSTAQQVYYQFTSITSPVVNDTTVDYVVIVDANSDAAILGQTLLYTTGGVIENIAAPASIASALFKNRLFLIDAEDRNLLWYSKQVIEGVPVEMSDLLTLYVAPTSGAQGSTGPMTAISAMDDKLIIFKKDAIYYLTGTGPDNTGANNDFTDPVFITSSVGCANPNSIVLMPNGLMFQSDKGIWLLGRDLSTNYIGAAVEAFNDQVVLSSEAIPATNQVRFVLPNSITLMYDYYFNQWGTFSNINAISATLYQSFQTYLNEFGQVFQETPGTYKDGSSPVLVSLTTSWINLAGLQGYERFYFMYLLGTYLSPFRLNVSLAYDYNSGPTQSVVVQPDNFTPPWGGDAQWGSNSEWGGPGNVFEARVFPQKQKCESFQVSISEIFDSSIRPNSAQGLTLSGLNLVTGIKKGYRTQRASKSFG